MKNIILVIFMHLMFSVQAQQNAKIEEQTGPPGTEIIMASVDTHNDQLRLTDVRNITSRKGYDSQPEFMDKDQAVYYTKFINNQTDIYRYDLDNGETTAITQTPESEYSPTAMPSNKGVSVVRVDKDNSQNVYWLENNKAIKMNDIDNVGYINWSGKNKLWMFIINGETGNLFYQNKGKKPQLMASNIGRAIKVDKKSKSVFYVDKNSYFWWINTIDAKELKSTKVIALPKGVEDFTIDNAGNFWCARGNTLFHSTLGKNWVIVKEFNIPGLSNITRIDINSKMTQIAITFDEIISK